MGAASRDLTPDDPRGWRLGGAVSYAGLTLARLGLRVRAVLATDAAGATAGELDWLRGAGAELHVVVTPRAPVFVNEEGPDGRVQRCVETADRLDIGELPADWARSADAVLLGPIADELEPDWARLGVGRPLALGWQGLLRTLVAGESVRHRPPAPSALLRAATIVGLSRTDVDRATPLSSLERLLAPGTTLVLTDAERGGLVGEPGGRPGARRWRAYPAIPADAVRDPTGAGDVFLAALLAARLDPVRLGGPGSAGRGLDLRLAAAAASLSVEGHGLAGVPTLDAVFGRVPRVRAPGLG